jgi:outer membrane protein assembly factor BamD
MKVPVRLVPILMLALLLQPACFLHHNKTTKSAIPTTSAEPDKVLYEKALKDVAKGRYDIGRLTLQTLLNTYPDSDYKEKAKLAIADSYFKQGGTTGLVQAEAEYRDFMTFFPTSDDADDAQMRIAMTHYQQMEKPDRDFSQSVQAEKEFKNFLEMYPDSPLADEARMHLREVQEVLAQHSIGVARQSMLRRNYRGTVQRTRDVLEKYPDFSSQDQALFLIASAYEKNKELPKAGFYYGVLVSYHPMSLLVEESRRKLEQLNMPIPEPNPEALARAREDQDVNGKKSFMGRMSGMFSKKPDTSMTRKANRPPIPIIPKPVDASASAGNQGGTTVPPATGAAADVSSGVAAEIVTPSRTTSQKESPNNSPGDQPASATPGSKK